MTLACSHSPSKDNIRCVASLCASIEYGTWNKIKSLSRSCYCCFFFLKPSIHFRARPLCAVHKVGKSDLFSDQPYMSKSESEIAKIYLHHTPPATSSDTINRKHCNSAASLRCRLDSTSLKPYLANTSQRGPSERRQQQRDIYR